eukprot:TRINITY_DN12427_c0_g1_i1.p1 TRINITY_DN12427_c0_g1~~TRINITY_DN12427_c0_g1_i1.p1  ORF type:complete len:317 (+),score=77.43 TRINITY_DN12427_c0_g1_i1:42-992(+)
MSDVTFAISHQVPLPATTLADHSFTPVAPTPNTHRRQADDDAAQGIDPDTRLVEKYEDALKAELDVLNAAQSPGSDKPSFSQPTSALEAGTPVDRPRPYDTEKFFVPSNTIFAFDLHHVIMDFSVKEMLQRLWGHQHKMKTLRLLLQPGFVADLAAFSKGNILPEKFILDISEKYGPTAHISVGELVRDVANCQTPNQEIVEVIMDLKQKGFKIYLFSNIGENLLLHLRGKLPTDVFQHFDGFLTARAADDFAVKPSTRAFDNFWKTFVPHRDSQVIFVDDKQANIDAGVKSGMYGIRYTSPKQLQQELRKLHILE